MIIITIGHSVPAHCAHVLVVSGVSYQQVTAQSTTAAYADPSPTNDSSLHSSSPPERFNSVVSPIPDLIPNTCDSAQVYLLASTCDSATTSWVTPVTQQIPLG